MTDTWESLIKSIEDSLRGSLECNRPPTMGSQLGAALAIVKALKLLSNDIDELLQKDRVRALANAILDVCEEREIENQ